MMATSTSGILRVPELAALVLDYVKAPPDLLNCACVNRDWSDLALQRLYRGSVTDARLITPDIPWLDSLLVASRTRFKKNLSYVEHLQLWSEKPHEFSNSALHMTLAVAKCRALRRENDARMLFISGSKGRLKSLSIPFYLAHNDLEVYKDLLFVSSLNFMVLDIQYCGILASKLEANKAFLPQLTGLFLHLSTNSEVPSMWKVLRLTNLKVIGAAISGMVYEFFKELDDEDIPGAIRQHTKLQAFSLDSRDEWRLADAVAEMAAEEFATLWPDLKALEVEGEQKEWLERFLRERQLKKLVFGGYDFDFNELKVESPHLTVLHTMIPWTHNGADLLPIAKRFPMLKYLDVDSGNDTIDLDMATDTTHFKSLLEALPHLEVLSTQANFLLVGSHLHDIKLYCRRLRHVYIPRSTAILTYDSLKEAAPLVNLVEFDLESLIIPKAIDFLEDPALQLITDAWEKVFPDLRQIPCSAAGHTDINGVYRLEPVPDYIMEENQLVLQDTNPVGVPDSESVSWFLRERIWHRLGYSECSPTMEHRRKQWLKEYEATLFGYPLINSHDYYK